MAFVDIINYTMTIPDDVNNNFYHVAQGTVLPRGGDLLDATTSVNDIGSATYRFKDAYVTNINNVTGTANPDGLNLMWQLVAEVYPTTNRVAITGLNGDASGVYDIIFYGAHDANTALSCFLNVNGDSTTANYAETYFRFYTLVWAATTVARIPVITSVRQATTGSQVGMGKCTLYTKTGQIRTGIIDRAMYCNGSSITYFEESFFRWSNTSSTITSLVFTFQTIPTYAYIGIWRRG